jgi:hypothetical protein
MKIRVSIKCYYEGQFGNIKVVLPGAKRLTGEGGFRETKPAIFPVIYKARRRSMLGMMNYRLVCARRADRPLSNFNSERDLDLVTLKE